MFSIPLWQPLELVILVFTPDIYVTYEVRFLTPVTHPSWTSHNALRETDFIMCHSGYATWRICL